MCYLLIIIKVNIISLLFIDATMYAPTADAVADLLPLALIARFYTGVSAAADVGCFCL